MTTPSFDDTDVAPTNDVAATRVYDELNVSSDAFWEQDTEERDLIFKPATRAAPNQLAAADRNGVAPGPERSGLLGGGAPRRHRRSQ